MVAGVEEQQFTRTQAFIKVTLLGNEGEALPGAYRIGDDINAHNAHGSFRGHRPGGKNADSGGLARTIWSEQAKDFASPYHKRDAIYCF